MSLTEGNSGPRALNFTVSWSNPGLFQTASVNYATVSGSATSADGDYTPAAGTVTFPSSGSTSTRTATVAIAVNGDVKFESDETFFVALNSASNATISDGEGVGTIQNDDPMPQISINDVAVTEGNAGATAMDFSVTLSNPSSQQITVNYATADDLATTLDGDYDAASGTLTFTPGQTSKTVTVQANGNTEFEPHENFFVNLSTPSNATIADGQGIGEILNDDVPVVFYVDQPEDFIVTTNLAGGPEANPGDIVSFVPTDGTQPQRAGLVFGANAFGTIQEAVDAAAAGNTLNVGPGTFAELVTINKTLVLQGNQFGFDARDTSRTGVSPTALESVVTGVSSGSFYVTADDGVLDGFTIQGQTTPGAGIRLQAGTASSQVRNNIVQNNIAGMIVSNRRTRR